MFKTCLTPELSVINISQSVLSYVHRCLLKTWCAMGFIYTKFSISPKGEGVLT